MGVDGHRRFGALGRATAGDALGRILRRSEREGPPGLLGACEVGSECGKGFITPYT